MCKEKFATIGLIINESKCKSTDTDNEVTFMGQKFIKDTPISRSEELIKTAEDCINVIDLSPISLQ